MVFTKSEYQVCFWFRTYVGNAHIKQDLSVSGNKTYWTITLNKFLEAETEVKRNNLLKETPGFFL